MRVKTTRFLFTCWKIANFYFFLEKGGFEREREKEKLRGNERKIKKKLEKRKRAGNWNYLNLIYYRKNILWKKSIFSFSKKKKLFFKWNFLNFSKNSLKTIILFLLLELTPKKIFTKKIKFEFWKKKFFRNFLKNWKNSDFQKTNNKNVKTENLNLKLRKRNFPNFALKTAKIRLKPSGIPKNYEKELKKTKR